MKLQRQFLGLDLKNVYERSNSYDALLKEPGGDEEASTTFLSDSENKRFSIRNNRFKKSSNNSFDLNAQNKIVSSDDDTSDHDSC